MLGIFSRLERNFSGMVELVPDCCTLCEIQSAVGAAGVFKDDVLKNWLEKQNPSEFQYKVVSFCQTFSFQVLIMHVNGFQSILAAVPHL